MPDPATGLVSSTGRLFDAAVVSCSSASSRAVAEMSKTAAPASSASSDETDIAHATSTSPTRTSSIRELQILEVMDTLLKFDDAQLAAARRDVERIRSGGAASASASAATATASSPPLMPSDAALKVELLDHLEHDVYVKLGVSAVEGCGVIAIRDIPAGVDPFPVCNREALNFDVSSSDEVSVVVTEHDLENRNLHPEVRRLVKSFFAPLTDEDGREMKTLGPPLEYGVNATGMNTLNVGWYLNHSENPNVRHFEAVEAGTFCTYVTTREIQAGEELFINYKELGPEYYKTVVEGVEKNLGGEAE